MRGGELPARPFKEFAYPDYLDSTREALAELVDGKDIVGFANRLIYSDGSVRWLNWNRHTPGPRRVWCTKWRETSRTGMKPAPS
jgi:hypothetical protein